jgi:glutamate-ammonia-ligase adenylyltransferase
MALTRARILAADEGFSDIVRKEIVGVLAQPRKADNVMAEVADMRARIEDEKRTNNPWHIKQVAGGLVDVEFIAQALQLIHAHKHPGILHANTADVLRLCVEKALIDQGDADRLLPSIRLYHNLTQILRVCLDGNFDPHTASNGLKQAIARAGEEPDIAQLELRLQQCQEEVRACFIELVGAVEAKKEPA